ncbi:ATP-binding cassette domain-containing protein, partial [Vibrio astriarenae]
MSSKIVARGVRMDYTVRNDAGQTEEVAVLRDFDLDVRDGEFLSVLGPSGCGKSTFLSILAGLTERTGGNIRIDGQALAGINPHQGV